MLKIVNTTDETKNRRISNVRTMKPTICCQSSICGVHGGILQFSTTEGVLIDGRDYSSLTSETSCHLTIRSVTDIVRCDGNDGNMQIFHAASNPDVITLFCIQTDGYKKYSSDGKPSLLTIVEVI